MRRPSKYTNTLHNRSFPRPPLPDNVPLMRASQQTIESENEGEKERIYFDRGLLKTRTSWNESEDRQAGRAYGGPTISSRITSISFDGNDSIRVIAPLDLCGQGNCEVRCPRASKICGVPVARRVFHAEPLPLSKAINSISPSLFLFLIDLERGERERSIRWKFYRSRKLKNCRPNSKEDTRWKG